MLVLCMDLLGLMLSKPVWYHHAPMQDLYHCLTVFSEWGVPYLLHATLCCSLYSYGAITGCLHYFGGSSS